MIRVDTGMKGKGAAKNLTQAAAEIGVSAITLKRWLLAGKVAEVTRNRNGWRLFAKSSQTAYPEVSDGSLAVTADTSASPNHAKESTLSGVIETGEVPAQILFEAERREGDAELTSKWRQN